MTEYNRNNPYQSPRPFAPLKSTVHRTTEMEYAGFWRRLGALLVDGLILFPLGLLELWVSSQSRTVAILSALPWTIVFCSYDVYFHARWGQTIGKMATGIRVVSLDGSPIAWRQAFLRSSVDIALGILCATAQITALMDFPESEYLNFGWLEQAVECNRLWSLMEVGSRGHRMVG